MIDLVALMARLVATSALGATPDTYLYRLAHLAGGSDGGGSSNNTSAVIGSDDVLRLFDRESLKSIHNVSSCHTGVTCLEALSNVSGPSGLVTAGRDGYIRFWDERGRSAGSQLHEPRGAAISALACNNGNNSNNNPYIIAAGTESTKEGLGDVAVLLFDTRNPSAPLRQYSDSHSDTITQLSFQPNDPNVLLSGSTDGLISIFDVSHEDEEDALQRVLNPRSAVHCSGFLPNTHTNGHSGATSSYYDTVYVLSTDEQLSVYGIDKAGATADDQALPLFQAGDVRDRLGCMYVIDLVQTTTSPISGSSSTPVMLAYGHNERRTLSLAPVTPETFEIGTPIDLPGAHGEEVVRDLSVLAVGSADATYAAYSCGEDGTVKVWSLSDERGSGTAGAAGAAASMKGSRKQSRKEKKAAERFTPY